MPTTQITRLGMVNAYLVEDDDGLTLVDTMLAAQQERGPRGGRPPRRPDRAHRPHPRPRRPHRLARRARRGAPGRRGRSSRPATRACWPRTRRPTRASPPTPSRAAATPAPARRPTRTIAPGDRVGALEVVAAPGHTPGHVAFLDARDGTLICGDAFSTLGGVATSAKPNPRFPLPALATWHRPTALQTARALRALEPRAPGPRPRARRRRPRRRDGRGDRQGELARVPRPGLDRARVVDAAAALADAEGLDAVTLARVAAGLGVRAPRSTTTSRGATTCWPRSRCARSASSTPRCARPRSAARGPTPSRPSPTPTATTPAAIRAATRRPSPPRRTATPRCSPPPARSSTSCSPCCATGSSTATRPCTPCASSAAPSTASWRSRPPAASGCRSISTPPSSGSSRRSPRGSRRAAGRAPG